MRFLILLFFIFYSANSESFEGSSIVELVYRKATVNYEVEIEIKNDKFFVSLDDLFMDSGLYVKKNKNSIKVISVDFDTIFEINVGDLTFKSDFVTGNFSTQDFLIIENRYFFDSRFISEFLRIDLRIHVEDMKMFYEDTSPFKVPIVEKVDRVKNREFYNPTSEKEYSSKSFSPSIISAPSTFHSFSASVIDGVSSNVNSHNVSLEMLGFEYNQSISINQDGHSNISTPLISRYDKNGLYPGLDATDIQLFRGSFFGVPGGEYSSNTSDIFISNGVRNNQIGKWGTRDFSGQINQNWEVEIYVNKKLISVQREKDGQYLFRDISLTRGMNEVEFIFIGPNGEIKKEKEFITINNDFNSLHRLNYNFSFNEVSKKKNEYSLLLNKPISDQFGLVAGVSNSYKTNEEDIYTYIGGNFSFLNNNLNLGLTNLNNKGDFLKISNFAKISNYDLVVSYTKKNNFDSDGLFEFYNAALSGISNGYNWNLSYGLSKNDFQEQNENYSLSLNKIYNKTNIGYSGSGSQSSNFIHNVGITRRMYDFSVDFSLTAMDEIQDYRLGFSRRFFDIPMSVQYNKNLINKTDDYRLSLSHVSGNINKSLSYTKNNTESSSVENISLSLSFGFGNILNPLETVSNKNTGGVIIKAFNDKNRNGKYDDGESCEENVFIKVGKKEYVSDKNGVITLSGLSSMISYPVVFSESNIDYIPVLNDFEITPHSSSLKTIYYPLERSFELEGKLTCKISNECSGVIIAIESLETEEKYLTYTTLDGFFYKNSLPMGKYKIYVVENDAYQEKIILNKDKPIVNIELVQSISN